MWMWLNITNIIGYGGYITWYYNSHRQYEEKILSTENNQPKKTMSKFWNWVSPTIDRYIKLTVKSVKMDKLRYWGKTIM